MIRNRITLATALLAVTSTFLTVPVEAQDHRWAFGLMGGGSVHGDLAPGPGADAVFEPGWLTGMQLEGWFGAGRVGVRVNGLWSQRQLDQAGPSMYNMFLAGTDLLIRLREPRPANGLAPFVGLGVGATHYSGVASTGTLLDGTYGDPVYRAHATVSMGMDLLASRRSGLRFEVGDQIVLPSIGRSPPTDGLPNVHNLVVTLGVQMRMGSLTRDTMELAAEPAPAAAPADGDAAPSGAELAARLQERERQVERLQARVDSLERVLDLQAVPAAATPPTAPTETAPAAGPAGASGTRFTVQIGSFVEAGTADRWVARLRARGLPVWRSDSEVQGQNVSRVRVGVLASEAEATTLADFLDREYGWPVWVDRVSEGETVPADATSRTRDVLYGSINE